MLSSKEFIYNITNGLLGMKRDIILKLCKMMWSKDNNVKIIVGMCREHFIWNKHPSFLKNRPFNFANLLRLNPTGGCVVCNTPSGPCCSFDVSTDGKTIFTSRSIEKGVFRWTITVAFAKEKGASAFFYIGAAPADLLSTCDDNFLGNVKGTAALFFSSWFGHKFASRLFGTDEFEKVHVEEVPIVDGSLIAVEADCTAQTLTFFVGNTKVPHAVSGVCPPLHFGVSGCMGGGKSSFTSVQFRRLPTATPSAVVCVMHKIGKREEKTGATILQKKVKQKRNKKC